MANLGKYQLEKQQALHDARNDIYYSYIQAKNDTWGQIGDQWFPQFRCGKFTGKYGKEVNKGNQILISEGALKRLSYFKPVIVSIVVARKMIVNSFPGDARIKKASISKEPKAIETLRERVYRRDGYKCLKCETSENLTLDHVVPRSKGGKGTFENYQTLCLKCNQEKGNRTFDLRLFKIVN